MNAQRRNPKRISGYYNWESSFLSSANHKFVHTFERLLQDLQSAIVGKQQKLSRDNFICRSWISYFKRMIFFYSMKSQKNRNQYHCKNLLLESSVENNSSNWKKNNNKMLPDELHRRHFQECLECDTKPVKRNILTKRVIT
jgi:hypothetical protein